MKTFLVISSSTRRVPGVEQADMGAADESRRPLLLEDKLNSDRPDMLFLESLPAWRLEIFPAGTQGAMISTEARSIGRRPECLRGHAL